MPPPAIYTTTLPRHSLGATSLPHIHYADAYQCSIHKPALVVDDLVYAFFDSSPKWVGSLMLLRNKLVRLVGLKAPSAANAEELRKKFTIQTGNGLGLFKVYARNANEVIMGEDDKHLDFRISFLLEDKGEGNYLFTLSTLVQKHNALGNLYFAPVKLFHKMVVPAMMKAMVRHVEEII